MTARIDGLTRQFNVASIGGRNRNDIHIMSLQGLGQGSVRLCALCPRSGTPEVIEIRFCQALSTTATSWASVAA